MVQLIELGFLKNVTVEAIVSTYSIDGQPNAAPMGIIMKDENNMVIRPYTSTQTSMNLKSKRCAVINITSDPELFYLTAFKEANPDGRLPLEWFQKAETVDAPRIRIIHSFIEVEVTDIRDFQNDRIEALCQVKLIKAPKVMPIVYCRALHAVIESIVHATRVKVLTVQEHEQKRVQSLLSRIDENSSFVKRVAPNSVYHKIMDDLCKLLKLWESKQ